MSLFTSSLSDLNVSQGSVPTLYSLNGWRWRAASIMTFVCHRISFGVSLLTLSDWGLHSASRSKKLNHLLNKPTLRGRPQGQSLYKLQVFFNFRKVLLKKFSCILHRLGCTDAGGSLAPTRGRPRSLRILLNIKTLISFER